MKILSFSIALLALMIAPAPGEERTGELWKDNRFTDEQPWPGQVISVASSWVGYEVTLIDIESKSKYCSVSINCMGSINYREIKGEQKKLLKEAIRKQAPAAGVTLLTPGVEVSRFNWAIGPHSLGQRFGERDLLFMTVMMGVEQDKEKAATTSADSNSKGSEEPHSETEVRSH